MDTLLSIKVFCLVAERRSFVAAATRFRISAAMVSKHVQHLERRLGTRLLNRSSRHVSLTEAGAVYFDRVRDSLKALDEVETAVGKATGAPRGTLRLSAPVWLATPFFVGLLAEFRSRYPEVSLDLDLSGRRVNLIDEGFDLVLRATLSPEEGLIARPLATIHFPLVGAPAYFRRHGRPRRPGDLSKHAMLWYSLAETKETTTLPGPDGPEALRIVPCLRSTNETLMHLAALRGIGLAFLPAPLVAADLAKGRLEQVLADYPPQPRLLYAMYPSRKYLSAKVRAFVDFLAQEGGLVKLESARE